MEPLIGRSKRWKHLRKARMPEVDKGKFRAQNMMGVKDDKDKQPQIMYVVNRTQTTFHHTTKQYDKFNESVHLLHGDDLAIDLGLVQLLNATISFFTC